ncbi:hypothetical protein MNV49_004998 [Pseudohyphozyma bogoriensis]|nr:hypothetical protein MNV49_004998 [Pseudohyphozyma bogoriensis]
MIVLLSTVIPATQTFDALFERYCLVCAKLAFNASEWDANASSSPSTSVQEEVEGLLTDLHKTSPALVGASAAYLALNIATISIYRTLRTQMEFRSWRSFRLTATRDLAASPDVASPVRLDVEEPVTLPRYQDESQQQRLEELRLAAGTMRGVARSSWQERELKLFLMPWIWTVLTLPSPVYHTWSRWHAQRQTLAIPVLKPAVDLPQTGENVDGSLPRPQKDDGSEQRVYLAPVMSHLDAVDVEDVRVAIVGDEGVGKSSLISTFIKSTLPEVTIPPSVSPGLDVTTVIIDTSPRPEDRSHLENEIRKAHVVGIVYAIDNPNSFDRVPTYWLPTIRSLGVNVPVILIGNKIDLRAGEVSEDALRDEIVPIMHEFKEVETCVESSAKGSINVPQVFYFAQNAVLHPTAPLYDSREHTLKPACLAALSRIFRLCDVNQDGLLSDDELNDFQRTCFNHPLSLNEIGGIKEVIMEFDDEGVRDGGVTESGFISLHTRFIQRGRLETTWKTLRCFGYGEDLQLREDFLFPRFDIPYDCTAELSPKGYQFLTELFETFDKDRDGALSPEELEALFSTSPGNPWVGHGFPETTITSDAGAVTLQGWLAQWSMTTLLDPRTTLSYLAYLGYPHSSPGTSLLPTTSALSVSRPRKADRKKGTVSRNVFLAYVLGAAGSGKTSILRSFVGKGLKEKWEATVKGKTVVNAVESGGGEKYLVLQEFGSAYESEVLKSSKKLAQADVLVFVYDSSDTNSFSYISNLRQQYALQDIPSIFVATKSDLDLAQQRHEVQPDTYCRKLSLPVPIAVSIKDGQTADLFHTIVRVAIHPLPSIPGGADRNSNRLGTYLYNAAIVGSVVAVGAVLYNKFAAAAMDMDQDEDLASVMNAAYSQLSQDAPPVPSGSGAPPGRQLDLVYLFDVTGSMGSYIASATKNCEIIVENILQSERLSQPDSLRIGLIAYRQDNSFILKNFGFTSDIGVLKTNLTTLYASGGGDGPEAVTAGMKAVVDLDWRPAAAKMVVLIADAPPHGIGEYGDGFASGSPDGEDPLRLIRQMASMGITFFVVACEPALSGYQYATDLFRALSVMSSGVMVPLTSADKLSHVIVGSALEQMDMERLIEEVGYAVAERVHGGDDIDDVARALHEKLLLRNESTKHLVFESIHRDSPEASNNVEVFTKSDTLADARPLLKKASGRVIGSRFTEKYLAQRYSSSYARTSSSSYSRPVPPTPAAAAAAPPSPPRKVISEFKPFAAATSMTMADTPLGEDLPAKSADDELTQSVELRFGQISLEQVKRITIASAWRTAPPRV